MTGEVDAADSPSPFADEIAASPSLSEGGLKVTIADILFCMFAVSVALAVQVQPWGEFKEVNAKYVVSALIVSLGASLFFAANRGRRAAGQSFFSMSPGFYLALICAAGLACDAFQYFVSFLDTHHVGDPVHILAEIAPYLAASTLSVVTVLRVNLAPRWQAVFIAMAGSAIFNGACVMAHYFSSTSDLSDPLNIAYPYLWRLGFATWMLSTLFLLIAYSIDCLAGTRREWWHHAAVILDFLGFLTAFFEDPELYQFLWQTYYLYLPSSFSP